MISDFQSVVAVLRGGAYFLALRGKNQFHACISLVSVTIL